MYKVSPSPSPSPPLPLPLTHPMHKHRGYREKGLYKSLQKNKELILKLLDPNTLEEISASFDRLLSSLSTEATEEGGEGGVSLKEKASTDRTSECSSRDSEGPASVTGGENSSSETDSDETDGSETEGGRTSRSSLCTSTKQQPMPSQPDITNHNSAGFSRLTNQIPVSGVYDPPFPGIVFHAVLEVMKYIDGMQSRLFAARLHAEVCESVCK